MSLSELIIYIFFEVTSETSDIEFGIAYTQVLFYFLLIRYIFNFKLPILQLK